jgi:hypothetical protein
MALLEKEATRFAESLDDYEHVSVTDIGGWGPDGPGLSSGITASSATTRSHLTATTGTSSARSSITASACRSRRWRDGAPAFRCYDDGLSRND